MLRDRESTERPRAIWALSEHHRFAITSLWELGPLLVETCDIAPGRRVLDVAAGQGNVAIRASEAGAEVIASDVTQAAALPFADASFDVVTSAVAAIFAPDHQTVADELLRVCRPGGTIGLVALAPSGAVLDLFELVGRFAPRPLFGGASPLEWGRDEHVRELFGDRVKSLTVARRSLTPSPLADLGLLEADHPALAALYRDLAPRPARLAALDRELGDLFRRHDGESQELLLIVARKRRVATGGDPREGAEAPSHASTPLVQPGNERNELRNELRRLSAGRGRAADRGARLLEDVGE